MKKFLLFFATLMFFCSMFAVEDTSLTQADDTVKTSERQAVMGFDDIGFAEDSATAAMQFCDTEGKCNPWSQGAVVSLEFSSEVKKSGSHPVLHLDDTKPHGQNHHGRQ